ncbi:MAG: ribonucleoside-diphosphate reductase [Pseudomonas balearica]|uniref:hypothetical protein n=1 Tax=Stutzerimonas balearica TaxID=74829 RepID=UPI00199AA8F3|nr:hypothetical protein [Stutzerimonas balearica]MBC7198161.1 ribonucleoside-diphosphate reductase [Stutzerimonas balearica]
MKEIKQKIVGVRLKSDEQEPARQDVNPLTLRIDRRPNGSLDAVSEKIEYSTNEGKKKVYVLISFLPVDGIHNGLPATVERPIEFFYPVGQGQWIGATMRSLSLAARGGYVPQALADLRKVVWDKGPVRCGKNAHGKPLYHDSEVAAIAWSIQQILHRRGFLAEDGSQVPLESLLWPQPSPEKVVESGLVTAIEASSPAVGSCPECSGDLKLMDGCPTCVEGCGYSKCG